VTQHAGALAGASHAGLVDDQHRSVVPEAFGGVEVERQPRQRPGVRDTGLLLELAYGASGGRVPSTR
jgi:hypothetical protein